MRRSALNFVPLALAMAAVLYITGPARLYSALQINGIKTQGTITAVECRKSTQFFYSFIVEGRSYTGSGTTIEECAKVKEWGHAPITYLATDPTQNFLGDPARALRADVLASLLACILLPGAVAVAIHLWCKHA